MVAFSVDGYCISQSSLFSLPKEDQVSMISCFYSECSSCSFCIYVNDTVFPSVIAACTLNKLLVSLKTCIQHISHPTNNIFTIVQLCDNLDLTNFNSRYVTTITKSKWFLSFKVHVIMKYVAILL